MKETSLWVRIPHKAPIFLDVKHMGILNNYEHKLFSQHGEDGITIKIIESLYTDPHNKYYVEFGVESGTECNTRVLREQYSWTGLMMDGSHEDANINLKRELVTKENAVQLFQKYNVPDHIHLLSVDIDYNDFYCVKEILKHYTCDILIFEYNGTHLPHEDKVVKYTRTGGWDGHSNYFGASLLVWKKLTAMYGYTLVCCDSSGTNCFFIRNNMLNLSEALYADANDLTLLYKSPTYGPGPNGGHSQDTLNRAYVSFEEAINI
jgi:hypothetical protein